MFAVADDNERILDLFGTLIENDRELELVGSADNGKDLYEIIRQKQPDVVLLDIIMPKMDGLTMMEKVNQDTTLKKHPAFIVVSAVGQDRITEDAFNLGAAYYILKPFDNDMLSEPYQERPWYICQEKRGKRRRQRRKKQPAGT